MADLLNLSEEGLLMEATLDKVFAQCSGIH